MPGSVGSSSATLSEELGGDVDVVLLDRTDGFVFGFAKLDVMFGRRTAAEVHHAYADIAKPGVRFVQADVVAIDPDQRRVETTAGAFEADALVVALGADLDPAATPGLVEAGHEFYTEAGAFATRDVLDRFEGGRVVVGVSSTPYKCPPAPSETALLVHDHLVSRGLRDRSEITLVLPLPSPVPPSPAASDALLEAFAERGIGFRPDAAVASLDPERRVAVLDTGDELPFDLYLGVPVHRAPAVVAAAGLTADPRDEGGTRFRRSHHKPGMMLREKLFSQIPIGRRHLRHPGQCQLVGPRSCRVRKARSDRPRASGEYAGMSVTPHGCKARWTCVGRLLSTARPASSVNQ